MIDTGANKCIIHDSLVPKENRNKLRNPVNIRQFNGELMQITECVNNIPIRINGETHVLPQTFISNQKVGYKFILGLNFILGNNGSILITPNGVNFFKKSTFIQPKYETHILPYEKKTLVVEKDLDLEFFDSLLEEEKDIASRSGLELDNDEVEILDDEEIDNYLEDIKCRKRSRVFRMSKMVGRNQKKGRRVRNNRK